MWQKKFLIVTSPGRYLWHPRAAEKSSYTHNADKSEPLDPHLGGEKSPDGSTGKKNVEDDALDRDKPGPVPVSPEGKDKPSYSHIADQSDKQGKK